MNYNTTTKYLNLYYVNKKELGTFKYRTTKILVQIKIIVSFIMHDVFISNKYSDWHFDNIKTP